MKISRWAIVLSGLVLFGAFVAWAQEEVMANQGTPGTRGPWPVTPVGGSGGGNLPDGGSSAASVPFQCQITSPNKVTSVTTASTTTPATAQPFRLWMNVCNSPQNAAGSIAKCRADGTAPVFAATNPGDVLTLGDCVTYYLPSTRNILCISNAAGGIDVQTYECF